MSKKRKRKQKRIKFFTTGVVALAITAMLTLTTASVVVAFGDKSTFSGSRHVEEKIEDSVVSVVTVNPGMGSCSGVVIRESENTTYVATAKHCIRRAEEVYVDHNRGRIYLASAHDDLAIVVVDGTIKDKKPVTIADSGVEIEDTIHHIGFPTGYPNLDSYKSSGTVKRITDDYVYANIDTVPGCSGGGIFDDDGNLVGILWGGYNTYNNEITIFESVDDLAAFMYELGYTL